MNLAKPIMNNEVLCMVLNLAIDKKQRGKGLGILLIKQILEEKGIKNCIGLLFFLVKRLKI